MNKDIIHIDTEDDITTIISKIKSSKERIIALVPPRRIGVLQSAVNMRLLARAAERDDKRIVIVTSDTVLAGLAATANIPVAKTLQSKPELAEIPVLQVDDNEIIDGGNIPVGELADAADSNRKVKKVTQAVIDKVIANDSAEAVSGSTGTDEDKRLKPKTTPKVPNFNVFRKKFMIIGGSLILLIAFLIWAIFFAPAAKVIISAKTTTETIAETVTLGQATDNKTNTIKAITKELTKEISVDFAATGKKNVGEKATGTVRLSNSSRNSVTIASGTILKNSGLSYVLTSSVTIPAATLGWDCAGRTCAGTADALITATEGGTQYNAASGNMSIAVNDVSASLKAPTGGGTDKTATVVTNADVENAKAKLAEQQVSGLKEELTATFGSSAKVISESYNEKRSEPVPSVLVDAEANGNVTLKAQVTAKMSGFEQADLQNYIEAKVKEELKGKESQKIYDNGLKDAKFSQYNLSGDVQTVRLSVNVMVGPEIDDAKVKEQSKGRTYGEIQSSIESISGVEDVDIKFSPFWVKSAPNNVNKIKVEFKLNNAS